MRKLFRFKLRWQFEGPDDLFAVVSGPEEVFELHQIKKPSRKRARDEEGDEAPKADDKDKHDDDEDIVDIVGEVGPEEMSEGMFGPRVDVGELDHTSADGGGDGEVDWDLVMALGDIR